MNYRLKSTLIAFGIPVLYALIVRISFGTNYNGWDGIYQVMSITFLLLVPTVIGFLTVLLSRYEKIQKIWFRIFAPWLPILFFFMITILASIEGWACWAMIFPVFLVAASIGGLFAGYLKTQKRNNRLNISIMILLPFLLGPLESLIDKVPTNYQAYTYIDIDAPAEKIWDNVTRVGEIPEEEDRGYLTKTLGFPRPIKAELNFEGVGAYREAIFSKGLIFHETVTEYEDNKKMVFNIEARPHEIPSTTLDEHVVIGGDYFDVLQGTYELEKLSNGLHRLHLYSTFEMSTTFNAYAGLWGKWIMKDIQNNILQVEKKRSERP